jgi:hypothetical protein
MIMKVKKSEARAKGAVEPVKKKLVAQNIFGIK